jgi:hypothetical protein
MPGRCLGWKQEGGMAQAKDRPKALRALAEEIAALLGRGLPQDQASLDTVLVVLGETDLARALARLAADPEASEHAPLAALMLSPDPAVLRELEPALALADCGAGEAQALADMVARHLADARGRVSALLPDGARAELSASADGLRAFVRRLRPEATAPAELRAILARRCGAESALELAVLLRHCRLTWTPERVFFIGTLLERADPGAGDSAGDDLPGLIAWATRFLDASGRQLALRSALAGRRQALLSQLRQAEFMEEALARGSYETLMSQGLRFAHVHGPEVRAELAFLERAGRLALGLPGESLDEVCVRDLGRAEDAWALLRLLPGLED